jgi:hypothetical protein
MSSTAAKTLVMPTVQIANHFSLSGGGIHVDFDRTSISGKPLLNYHDTVRTLNFIGDDIRVAELPDLGTVVSVTLSITPDVGSTTFSVLIPGVRVAGVGGTAPVTTDGITTIHKMPFVLPNANLGQQDLYRVTRLTGSASFVIS